MAKLANGAHPMTTETNYARGIISLDRRAPTPSWRSLAHLASSRMYGPGYWGRCRGCIEQKVSASAVRALRSPKTAAISQVRDPTRFYVRLTYWWQRSGFCWFSCNNCSHRHLSATSLWVLTSPMHPPMPQDYSTCQQDAAGVDPDWHGSRLEDHSGSGDLPVFAYKPPGVFRVLQFKVESPSTKID